MAVFTVVLLFVAGCRLGPGGDLPPRFAKCAPVTYTSSSLYGMCGLVTNGPDQASFKVVSDCGAFEPNQLERDYICESLLERLENAPTYDATKISDLYADKTRISYGPRHGNQVEYTDANGKAILWYPGQDQVVVGAWSVPEEKYVCFHYPGIAVDRIAGGLSDRWACHVIEDAVAGSETLDGDVFNLTKAYWVPYGLNRHPRTSVDEVKRKIKQFKQF